MKRISWKTYLLWIGLSLGVGVISAWLTRDGMKQFTDTVAQPPLAPPAWLFPIVWSILYVLMGIGAARVSVTAPSPARSRGLNLFILQLAVNFCWSLIFFNNASYGLAFAWLILLWVLVLRMIQTFRKTDVLAGILQIPYLIWLSFAAYLNAGVWFLNG